MKQSDYKWDENGSAKSMRKISKIALKANIKKINHNYTLANNMMGK